MSEPILTVEGLTQRFGGIVAIDDLSVSISRGEVFGLIGPNGAGKTTLLNCVCGVYLPARGRVVYAGRDITGRRPHRILTEGIARTFQAADFFGDMTVVEFLVLSRLHRQASSVTASLLGLPSVRRSERAERSRALDMLDRLELPHLADQRLSGLPYGARKLLDVGRALLTGADLLLMDEPTSGSSLADREALRRLVGEIRADGVTTVIVDHDVAFIADVADRLLAMNFGKALGVGTPREVLERPDVLEAYVGLETAEPATSDTTGDSAGDPTRTSTETT